MRKNKKQINVQNPSITQEYSIKCTEKQTHFTFDPLTEPHLNCKWRFKGIIHSHCHHLPTLHLFWTCMSFFFCSAQKKIFWRMLVTKQLMVAIDFHGIFSILGSQWLPSTVWLPAFFKISSFALNNIRHSYRLGMTWGRENDDRIVFLGELSL